jgi:hypothetical protein
MRLTSWIFASVFFFISVFPADAASIGVNFRRESGEQNMAASESAGVVPQLNWNNSDGAGDVDGSDLSRWKSGFGAPLPTHMQGDADSDGDADGADFLTWQREFGSGLPVAAAAAGVPEPASLYLQIFAIIAWYLRRVRFGALRRLGVR